VVKNNVNYYTNISVLSDTRELPFFFMNEKEQKRNESKNNKFVFNYFFFQNKKNM